MNDDPREWTFRIPGGIVHVGRRDWEKVCFRILLDGVGQDIDMSPDQAFDFAAAIAGCARAIKYREVPAEA